MPSPDPDGSARPPAPADPRARVPRSRDPLAPFALASAGLLVVSAWLVQLVTLPALKLLWAGDAPHGGPALGTLRAALGGTDLAILAGLVLGALGLLFAELRARTLSRTLSAALHGRRGPVLVVLAVTAVLAVRPYADLGVPGQFDGKAHWSRAAAAASLVADGEWPGWTFRFAGGQPIHRFFGPLWYDAVGLVAALGVPLVLALRIVLVGAHLLSAAALAAFVRRAFGSSRAAFAAAVLFLLVPPRFHSVMKLSRFPEAIVYLAFPLLLLAVENLLVRRRPSDVAWTALAAAALLLAHPSVGAVGCVVVAVYAIARFIALRPDRGAGVRTLVLAGAAGALFLGLVAFHVLPTGAERVPLQMGYSDVTAARAFLPRFPPRLESVPWLVLWNPLQSRPVSLCYLGLSLVLLTGIAAWRFRKTHGAVLVPLLLAALTALLYALSYYFGSRAVAFLAPLLAVGAGAAFLSRRGVRPVWLLVALVEILPFSVQTPFRPGGALVEDALARIAEEAPGRRYVLLGTRRGVVNGSQYQTGGASGLFVAGTPLPEESPGNLPWHLTVAAAVEDDVVAGQGLSPATRAALRLTGNAGVLLENGRELVRVPRKDDAPPAEGVEDRGPLGLLLRDAPPFLWAPCVARAEDALPDEALTRVSPREVPTGDPERPRWKALLAAHVAAQGVQPDAARADRVLVTDVADLPPPAADGPEPPRIAGRMLRASDTELVIEADVSRPGFAALACSWHPGLTITVDGAPVAPMRSSAGAPVVPLAAGRHEIVVRGPTLPADTRGFLVSGAACAAALLLVVLGRKSPR